MLVLTRKTGEKIKIGDNVVVNILSVEGSTVKIGIEAPRQVTILRMEVLEQLKNENIAAVAGDVKDIETVAGLVKKKLSNEKDSNQKEDINKGIKEK
jgi:carbon storage regulator